MEVRLSCPVDVVLSADVTLVALKNGPVVFKFVPMLLVAFATNAGVVELTNVPAPELAVTVSLDPCVLIALLLLSGYVLLMTDEVDKLVALLDDKLEGNALEEPPCETVEFVMLAVVEFIKTAVLLLTTR